MTHSLLAFGVGVPTIPGDITNTATVQMDGLNLLDPSGFSVDVYTPQIPNLKSDAVYADSPLADGRILMTGAKGNLQETLRLELNAGTVANMAYLLSKLNRIRDLCTRHWTTYNQIEPVYLKHQIEGEPAARYALIYNIEIHIDDPINPSDPNRTVTLSIEREPYWRGMIPFCNPQFWKYRNQLKLWDTTRADLTVRANALHSDTISNRLDFSDNTTIIRAMWTDIPADKIPGDAPALVWLTTTCEDGGSVYIARCTKPKTEIDRQTNTAIPLYNSLPAVMGVVGTNCTFTNSTRGCIYAARSASAQVGRVSFATATDQIRMTWDGQLVAPPQSHKSEHLWRGKYVVFARLVQNAGAVGDITFHLTVSMANGGGSTVFPAQPTVDNSGNPFLYYFGVVDIPIDGRTNSDMKGRGGYVASSSTYGGYFQALFYAARSTGAATLDIVDLIFVPIDECMIRLLPNSAATGTVVYDGTGYSSRADEPVSYITSVVTNQQIRGACELQGEALTLEPKVDNRLIFLYVGTNVQIPSNDQFTVTLNIVPRWQNLRDIA